MRVFKNTNNAFAKYKVYKTLDTKSFLKRYKLINTLIQIKITHNTKTLKTRYKVNKTYKRIIKLCKQY